jgi:hypothetical protein
MAGIFSIKETLAFLHQPFRKTESKAREIKESLKRGDKNSLLK